MDVFALGDIALAALTGLLIGSFLNVVIHRLPQMMEQQWDAECAQHAAAKAGKEYTPATPALTLCKPRSRCPHCGHAIALYENIPVLSWLALRGKCRGCSRRISIRYPLVEVATAALFAWCIHRWGLTATGVVWCGFSAALLTLALIDWDTTYLPDDITLPLVWSGLIVAALQWNSISLSESLWGAVAGYMSLWLVYWGFKLLTGKEGMGYGDFKLFAALGAWFGWQALVPLILLASVIGAIIGIVMKLRSSLREGGYIPFGPFLAGAGFAVLFWGHDRIMQTVLRGLGV